MTPSVTNAGGSSVVMAAPYAGAKTPDSTNSRRFPISWSSYESPPMTPDVNSDTADWVSLDDSVPWASASFGKGPLSWKYWVVSNVRNDSKTLPSNQLKPFPEKWGSPPIETSGYTAVTWPHGFGFGGPQTKVWISSKLARPTA
jgi:hypothetical protein